MNPLVTVTYTYRCSACDAIHKEVVASGIGCELFMPYLPLGWRGAGRLLCPKHKVRLLVDDETEMPL